MKKAKIISGIALTFASAIGVWSCNSSGSGEGAASTQSYQGLGSRWTASFTGSNFVITYDETNDGTVEMTVNGTYVEYSNKFRKLTVTSASGVDAPDPGDEAYGIEIPGYAFFLKPLGEDSEPIVMIKAGSCTTEDFEANWLIAKYEDGASQPQNDSEVLGVASFSFGADAEGYIHDKYDFQGNSIAGGAGNTILLGDCNNGVQEWTEGGGPTQELYLTSNGGLLVEGEGGIIFGSPKGDSDPTSDDWDGDYSGLVFSEGSDDTFPAKLTLSGDSGEGFEITDVEADTLSVEGVDFADFEAVSGKEGMIRGTVDTGSGALPIHCIFSQVAGSKVLACLGADGAAVSGTYPTFFFLGTAR